jgi:hypothetical protein
MQAERKRRVRLSGPIDERVTEYSRAHQFGNDREAFVQLGSESFDALSPPASCLRFILYSPDSPNGSTTTRPKANNGKLPIDFEHRLR